MIPKSLAKVRKYLAIHKTSYLIPKKQTQKYKISYTIYKTTRKSKNVLPDSEVLVKDTKSYRNKKKLGPKKLTRLRFLRNQKNI